MPVRFSISLSVPTVCLTGLEALERIKELEKRIAALEAKR